MTAKIITVPDIGGHSDVDVIEVCVKVGDQVNEGDSLIVLETDKASMEVPAEFSGVISKLLIKEGDSVSEGDAIVEMMAQGAEAAAPAAPAASAAPAPAPVAAAAPAASAAGGSESIVVPDIGGHKDVDIIEVCVKVGDEVAEGDSLIVLETDNAS